MADARLRTERLASLRKAAGLRQSDLAEMVGSPGRDRRVGEWERGEAQPRPEHLVRLAAALGVHPLELLEVDPDDPPLVALRFAAGLTLAKVSQASGLSTKAFLRLETGVSVSDADPAAAERLAAALGVSVERLVRACARSRADHRGR